MARIIVNLPTLRSNLLYGASPDTCAAYSRLELDYVTRLASDAVAAGHCLVIEQFTQGTLPYRVADDPDVNYQQLKAAHDWMDTEVKTFWEMF